jgi:hypothetical protein
VRKLPRTMSQEGKKRKVLCSHIDPRLTARPSLFLYSLPIFAHRLRPGWPPPNLITLSSLLLTAMDPLSGLPYPVADPPCVPFNVAVARMLTLIRHSSPETPQRTSRKRKHSNYTDLHQSDDDDDLVQNGSGRKSRPPGTKRACNQCRQQKVSPPCVYYNTCTLSYIQLIVEMQCRRRSMERL